MKKRILIIIFTILTIYSCSNKEYIDIDGLDIKYYQPSNKKKFNNIALIFIGGSEGGFPLLFNINKYRTQGIPCFSVAYFNTSNTPKHLDKININRFEDLFNKILSKKEFNNKKLILFGYSKGGELSLLLSSYFPSIKGVVVLNPSNIIFQSPHSLKSNTPSSSWAFNGNELGFLEFPRSYSKEIKGKNYRELYSKAISNSLYNFGEIKIENINGPILIVTGSDDIVWPSTSMANKMTERLNKHNFPFWYKHINYENAGHTLNPIYGLGGTFKGNYMAKASMELEIMDFLISVDKE